MADRGDRPRRRCVNEEALPVDEFSRDGAPRIDAAAGAVDVDDAKGYVMDLGAERPKGDSQLARRVLPECLDRFTLTSTNQKINRNVHEHLHGATRALSQARTNRPLTVIRKTPRAIKRSNTV